jgi:hypothetical protein
MPRFAFTFPYEYSTENVAKLYMPPSEYLLTKEDNGLPQHKHSVCNLSMKVSDVTSI